MTPGSICIALVSLKFTYGVPKLWQARGIYSEMAFSHMKTDCSVIYSIVWCFKRGSLSLAWCCSRST